MRKGLQEDNRAAKKGKRRQWGKDQHEARVRMVGCKRKSGKVSGAERVTFKDKRKPDSVIGARRGIGYDHNRDRCRQVKCDEW